MSRDIAEAILGVLLGRSESKVLASLTDDDFEDGRHKLIVGAMRSVSARGIPVDPISVRAELAAHGNERASGGSTYLHHLHDAAPLAASLDYWAGMLREATRVRMAAFTAAWLVETLAHEEASADLPLIVQRGIDRFAALPPLLSDDGVELQTVADLLEGVDPPIDWIIPGLLSRQERVVITGGEGVAKSTLMKQFGVSIAAGLNPFNGARVSDGLRVLHIDVENSEPQNRRNYRWISQFAGRGMAARGWGSRIVHVIRNEGLDLVGRDRAWFTRTCDAARPDVIIIGPLYKLMKGGLNPNSDVDMTSLLMVLDEVRVRHNAAMIVEAHSGHTKDGDQRSIRPRGSSVLLGWPEVGIGLTRDHSEFVEQQTRPDHLEVGLWRQFREPRDWPDLICFGPKGGIPWVPTRDDWKPSVDTDYQAGEYR